MYMGNYYRLLHIYYSIQLRYLLHSLAYLLSLSSCVDLPAPPAHPFCSHPSPVRFPSPKLLSAAAYQREGQLNAFLIRTCGWLCAFCLGISVVKSRADGLRI